MKPVTSEAVEVGAPSRPLALAELKVLGSVAVAEASVPDVAVLSESADIMPVVAALAHRQIPETGVQDIVPPPAARLACNRLPQPTNAFSLQRYFAPQDTTPMFKYQKEARRVRPDRTTEDGLKLYLDELSTYPLLTAHGEVILAKAIAAGGETDPVALPEIDVRQILERAELARKTFVTCNLGLVVSVARKFQAGGLPLVDLIQAGNRGLMKAVDKFDHTKGFKFSSYATWWIRKTVGWEIAHAAREIRLPEEVAGSYRQIETARQEFEREKGYEPSRTEWAARAGVSEEELDDIMLHASPPLSIYKPYHNEGDSTLCDVIYDSAASVEADVFDAQFRAAMTSLLNHLTERERQIIILRYGLDRGEPRQQAEVRECTGYTQQQVRRSEQIAMQKLRIWADAYGFKVYLQHD